MPRRDLPRYTIPLTLTEAQVERLEEMAGKLGILAQDSNSIIILQALAAYDIIVTKGMLLDGPTVFAPTQEPG